MTNAMTTAQAIRHPRNGNEKQNKTISVTKTKAKKKKKKRKDFSKMLNDFQDTKKLQDNPGRKRKQDKTGVWESSKHDRRRERMV